jgi:hypothetical protein
VNMVNPKLFEPFLPTAMAQLWQVPSGIFLLCFYPSTLEIPYQPTIHPPIAAPRLVGTSWRVCVWIHARRRSVLLGPGPGAAGAFPRRRVPAARAVAKRVTLGSPHAWCVVTNSTSTTEGAHPNVQRRFGRYKTELLVSVNLQVKVPSAVFDKYFLKSDCGRKFCYFGQFAPIAAEPPPPHRLPHSCFGLLDCICTVAVRVSGIL